MALTLTYPQHVNLSGNPVLVDVATTTTGVTSHKLHIEIIFTDETIKLQQPVVAGESVFDISEFLQKEYTRHFNYFDTNTFFTSYSIVDKFKLNCWETYDNDGIEHGKITGITYTYYFQGGLNRQLLTYYALLATDFFTDFIIKKRFLTWQPNNKIINILDIEKLYFYGLQDVAARLYIDYTTVSGATVQHYKSITVKDDRILEINASPLNLGIDDSADNIVSYEIYITDTSDNLLSEKRKYYIDRTFYKNKRKFIFKNSLGVFDTIRTIGKTSISPEYSASIVDTGKKINSACFKKYKTNSGHLNLLSKDPLNLSDYFDELFLSKEVYIVDNNNNILPITILSSSRVISEDDKYLYSFDFEYYLLYDDKFYSKTGYDSWDFNNDFNNDFNS
jgi:hypothetical protein